MLKHNILLRFFIIFAVTFIALISLSSLKSVRSLHCKVYSAIAQPIFNVINPHIYTAISSGAIENDKSWDITFKVWDKRQYGRELFVPSFRKKNLPKAILYQNHHEIILVPILFLIALMVASPINWKSKLWKLGVAFILFYFFMTLYLSYRFEWSINRQDLPLDSIWHTIISFFGLGGNTDPIYILVFLIWIIMVVPQVIRKKGILQKL